MRTRYGVHACKIVMTALVLCQAATVPVFSQNDAAGGLSPLLSETEHEPPVSDVEFLNLELDLRLDAGAARAYGVARYAAAATRNNLSRIVLFSADSEINGVEWLVDTDSTHALEFEQAPGDSLIILLADTLNRGEQVTFAIDYVSNPSRGMYFSRPDRPFPNRRVQVWTGGAPEDTRHWLPVFDFPNARLTTDFRITVADPLLALSNGELVGETAAEDDWTTFQYRQSMPHSPHLFSIVAGEYEIVRDMLTLPGARRVPLQYWVYPERIGDVYRTFGRTPEIIAFFGQTFDYPYPWDKYATAVVQDITSRAEVQTGAVTLSDGVLIDERAALDNDPDQLVAQNIARQWFGSLVTANYWDHIWLNEGFAKYFEAAYAAEAGGEEALQLRMFESKARYLEEASHYRRPLVWNRWEDPINVFDAHSEHKGAWVLHMLRHRMGNDQFDRMIRRYVRTHAFENVETHHLETVAVDVIAADLSRFFDQWVYAAGHPELEITYTHDFADRMLRVSVRQTQSGDMVPETFRFTTTIEASSLGEIDRFELQVGEREQVFSFPLSMQPDFLVFDPDQTLLATVRIEQPAINWMRQLRGAGSVTGRIFAARMLAEYSDDPALLLGLREAFMVERSSRVRGAIVETMGHIAPTPVVERSLYAVLEDEDPAVRKATMRALGVYQSSPEVSAAAMRAAESDDSYEVVAEAVRTLARVRAPQAFDVVQSALVTSSHREVIRAAAFDAMVELGTPPARAFPLANEWTRPDRPVDARIAATRYLGFIAARHQPAMRRLTELATDRNVPVRKAAVHAMAQVGTRAARNHLQQMAEHDPDARVRAQARRAIAHAD